MSYMCFMFLICLVHFTSPYGPHRAGRSVGRAGRLGRSVGRSGESARRVGRAGWSGGQAGRSAGWSGVWALAKVPQALSPSPKGWGVAFEQDSSLEFIISVRSFPDILLWAGSWILSF
jgi:hypothetical protein